VICEKWVDERCLWGGSEKYLVVALWDIWRIFNKP